MINAYSQSGYLKHNRNTHLYDSSRSLKEDFFDILDPKISINKTKLMNLVYKYFVAYIYPETFDLKLKQKDIADILDVWLLHQTYKHKAIRIRPNNTSVSELLKIMKHHHYGLNMLGDVGSSIALIQDIISKKIDRAIYDRQYLGIDLGSGTGILLLAQYVQAVRNNFSTISNIGIEINTHMATQTNKLVKQLGFGTIKNGDITLKTTYNDLGINQEITHISNETITNPKQPMYQEENENINFIDPFYPSIDALYGSSIKNNITSNTSFFPQGLEIHTAITEANNTVTIGTAENKFGWEDITEMELEYMINNRLSREDNILAYTYPTRILIGKEFINLEDVGKDIDTIYQLPNKRWALYSTNSKHYDIKKLIETMIV